VSSYLSTTTVLYKRDGFSDAETALLRKHNGLLSFDEIYSPGFDYQDPDQAKLLEDYRNQIFGSGAPASDGLDTATEPAPEEAADIGLPSTRLARLAWQAHVKGTWAVIARDYVFDTSLLTNAHPYFAAYIKTADLATTVLSHEHVPAFVRAIDHLLDNHESLAKQRGREPIVVE
jgi:hypothetical protein